MICKLPLVLTPQPEGGFTITSPLLPELVTEGDTIEEVLANVRDALEATLEAYKDLGRPLPTNIQLADVKSPLWLETLVATRCTIVRSRESLRLLDVRNYCVTAVGLIESGLILSRNVLQHYLTGAAETLRLGL